MPLDAWEKPCCPWEGLEGGGRALPFLVPWPEDVHLSENPAPSL